MALRTNIANHVYDNLQENLQAVEYCLSFRKDDGGCLGAPAALLLFCTIEAMGNLQGKREGDSLDIIRGAYLRQELTVTEKGKFYSLYRSNLAHNAAVREGLLVYDAADPDPFPRIDDRRVVNVHALYAATRDALDRLLQEYGDAIGGSKSVRTIPPIPMTPEVLRTNSGVAATGIVSDIIAIEPLRKDEEQPE